MELSTKLARLLHYGTQMEEPLVNKHTKMSLSGSVPVGMVFSLIHPTRWILRLEARDVAECKRASRVKDLNGTVTPRSYDTESNDE